jgi:hypothetical protein
MIELSERILAIWFLQLDEESDFMACLQQEGKDYYTLSFRFRYYVVEGHPHSGWDKKNWYKGDFHGSRDDVLKAARQAIHLAEQACGNKADEIMCTTAEEYVEALKSMPWAHMRVATPDETGEIFQKEIP